MVVTALPGYRADEILHDHFPRLVQSTGALRAFLGHLVTADVPHCSINLCI
jgi:hypothetical protein